MKDYTWKSTVSNQIQSYIALQRTAGFKFITQERILQHFDHYFYYSGYQGTQLTKDLISDFIYSTVSTSNTERSFTFFPATLCKGKLFAQHGVEKLQFVKLFLLKLDGVFLGFYLFLLLFHLSAHEQT